MAARIFALSAQDCSLPQGSKNPPGVVGGGRGPLIDTLGVGPAGAPARSAKKTPRAPVSSLAASAAHNAALPLPTTITSNGCTELLLLVGEFPYYGSCRADSSCLIWSAQTCLRFGRRDMSRLRAASCRRSPKPFGKAAGLANRTLMRKRLLKRNGPAKSRGGRGSLKPRARDSSIFYIVSAPL